MLRMLQIRGLPIGKLWASAESSLFCLRGTSDDLLFSCLLFQLVYSRQPFLLLLYCLKLFFGVKSLWMIFT